MAIDEVSDRFSIKRRSFLAVGLAAMALPIIGKATSQNAAPDEFDAFVSRAMRSANIPGLAVGFAREGKVHLARGYGFADLEQRRPATADTIFHIASVTKTVTATGIMQLAASGHLVLDEPIGPHLDFPLVNPNHPDKPITFRHLLMHTSGISDAKYYEVDYRQPGSDATLPLETFLKNYLVPGGKDYSAEKCFSEAVPGALWDYCNVGYGLLGYLGTRIGKRDFREQTRDHIFTPLGMQQTSWTISDTPAALRAVPYDSVNGVLTPVESVGFPDWSAGMLRSSVADFTRFVAASANGGIAQGVKLIDPSALAQMLAMQTPAGLPDWLSGQGLGWAASKLDGVVRPNHWGGDPGVFTAVYLDPASRSGVAIFTNATASTESKAAVKSIANHLFRRV